MNVEHQSSLRGARQSRRIVPESRFRRGLTRSGRRSIASSIGGRRGSRFGVAYTLFYIAFATELGLLLFYCRYTISWGPIHGAIVNYFGHKVGYRNFETPHGRQVAQHPAVRLRDPGASSFRTTTTREPCRRTSPGAGFEIDPTWPIIRSLAWLRIVQLGPQSGPRRLSRIPSSHNPQF